MGTVTNDGQIGYETGIPEEKTHDEVRGYGDHVKDQWGLEIRPQIALVWVWKKPIEDPNAS